MDVRVREAKTKNEEGIEIIGVLIQTFFWFTIVFAIIERVDKVRAFLEKDIS